MIISNKRLSVSADVKRIYYETKQTIKECNFLSKQELDKLMLTQAEQDLILNVNESQVSLIKAATLLRELHARFLRIFVLSAFDLTWDMLTTPKRFEYAKQKELELYNSMMSTANLKQEEIKTLIHETIVQLKSDLLEQLSSASASYSINSNSNNSSNNISSSNISSSNIQANHNNHPHNSYPHHRHHYHNQQHQNQNHYYINNHNYHRLGHHIVEQDKEEEEAVHLVNAVDDDDNKDDDDDDYEEDDDDNDDDDDEDNGLEDDFGSSSFTDRSIETIYSKNELQLYRQEIQEFVLQQLNASIANKLVGSVESLRNSYVGTLERCLASLEQNCVDNNEPPNASLALRQILNAAYRVEVSVESSISVVRVIWAKLKQLVSSSLPIWNVYYNNYGCIIDNQWKRQQAMDIIDNISESRLAKSICSQFRQRLKQSHEQFLQSMRELEMQHAGRLQNTEELRLRVRKLHAPRMAKFALESTSLIDLILYGMPCLEKEIGRGQYGVVYACESWAGYSPCAIKSVVPPDDKHWYDLAMEFYYTRCIPEHERIVSIYGSVIDHTYGSGSTPAVLLVMERLNRDLYSAIKAGLDWLSRLQVAIDVVEGIRFLHNQGLVHRDIKLKNILLDAENRAKITDLGFCKPEAMMSGSVVGTPIHMSPELFSGRYDNSVDVYAFGILFWYICAGHVRLPHIFEQCQTRDQLWNCVRKGVRPERLPQFDNECWQLMVQCWDGDKTKRPHLGDVEIWLRRIQTRYT